ncbi:MAG: hypothetical protein ACUVV5_09305 [Candidatus Aminicenantales bacterium]
MTRGESAWLGPPETLFFISSMIKERGLRGLAEKIRGSGSNLDSGL